jgi:malate synthase
LIYVEFNDTFLLVEEKWFIYRRVEHIRMGKLQQENAKKRKYYKKKLKKAILVPNTLTIQNVVKHKYSTEHTINIRTRIPSSLFKKTYWEQETLIVISVSLPIF